MRHRLTTALLALLLSGCDQGVSGEPGLRSFESCGELEGYLKAETTRHMNAQIDARLRNLGPIDDARSVAAPTPAAYTATSYTTTNTQERGVDEPDFVKNDGARIFLLQGQSLVILNAWPPTSLSIQSTTPIEGYPEAMFLDGRHVVVFSTLYDRIPVEGSDALTIVFRYATRTKLSVFDVSGSRPVPAHELYIEEGYRNARKTGRFVRLVTSAQQLGPQLRYWPEGPLDWTDPAAVRAAYELLRTANARTIKDASLDEWLPPVTERRAGAPLEAVARDCTSFHASGARTGLGLTTVSSLDLDRLGQRSAFTSVLSPVSEVYSSREALYLAARNEPWQSGRAASGDAAPDRTYLHKFAYAAERVRYAATGSVPGYVADQFAMDEQDGDLRVATTEGSAGNAARPSTSGVYVLRAIRGALTTIGTLAGLAPGEQLYSARFEGARGYLVTFRQVDPLFTLDLRRPTAPRLAGELKVPGFSTYLHPIDAGHLLTIGRDVSEDGRVQNGLQLQIFDVSDLAHPSLLHKYVPSSPYGYSDASYDHKAFNFFAARGLLAIPYSEWMPGGTYRASIDVYRVSTQRGIEPVGSVDHLELPEEDDSYLGRTRPMRRSVMMEDYVYSISWSWVKVNDVRELSHTIASVRLPEAQRLLNY